jgi:hypothetical protein
MDNQVKTILEKVTETFYYDMLDYHEQLNNDNFTREEFDKLMTKDNKDCNKYYYDITLMKSFSFTPGMELFS